MPQVKQVALAVLVALGLITSARPAALMDLDADTAHQVAALLKRAGDDGLDAGQYRAADGAALAAFARDVALGRPKLRSLDSDVALPAPSFDAEAVVAKAVAEGKPARLPELLAPPYPQYVALKKALARYRAIADAGGWPELTAAARNYAAEPQATLLRKRLSYEDGQVAADVNADLTDALKRFQLHHGLVVDGILGRATLAELNVPAAARAGTILANMERWRWLPRALEPDRIVINAASAELVLVLDNHVVLASRVIVGRPRDPTPILRAEGASLTVNPPWNVPTSIAAREILPKLKRDRSWLARNDMVLLNGPPGDPAGRTVNWRAVPAATFPYRLRQHPGPENPLGRVKMELPNRFDVYLHDTPGRAAFARQDRHLSHGCVRVEQILPLASYAISSDLASIETIVAAIDAGETAHLPLHRMLPVYFLYWTAFSDPDGAISFRPDVYGRDARLLAALRRPTQIAAEIPELCPKG
ncbi:MAG: hypothetical protein BGN85_07045 [Alphaproteobacteria bacterium 64-11]|nr:MAG: hypothetical protein BGN85_07045 [Alphaproteobacteria bacterium 64-11]